MLYSAECNKECMPINRDYRTSWHVVGTHNGHDVWSPSREPGKIHGTTVGVHFESCIGCLKCIEVCPTNVFERMRLDSALVVDPMRESECILCLACEMVCPVEAIAVVSSGGSDKTLDSLLSFPDDLT